MYLPLVNLIGRQTGNMVFVSPDPKRLVLFIEVAPVAGGEEQVDELLTSLKPIIEQAVNVVGVADTPQLVKDATMINVEKQNESRQAESGDDGDVLAAILVKVN